MKLLEVRGEEALSLLGDIFDPIVVLAQDPEILHCIETGQKVKAIKYALKKHPKTILELMALCEGVPVEDYKPAIYELPSKLLEIVNHPEVAKLFTTQAQTAAPSIGSATEITTEQNQ